VLYHGTGHGAVEAILREGLRKMSRHHVHLSKDIVTAKKLGQGMVVLLCLKWIV
jgi:putative RNA 2'-phosphotransferase